MKRRDFIENSGKVVVGGKVLSVLVGCNPDQSDPTNSSRLHCLDSEGNYVSDAQIRLDGVPRATNNGIYDLSDSEFGTYDVDFTSDSVWDALLAVRDSINGSRTAKKDAITRDNQVGLNGNNIYLIEAKKRDVVSATSNVLSVLNKDKIFTGKTIDAQYMYGSLNQKFVPGIEFPRDTSLYKDFSIEDFVNHKDNFIFTPGASYSIEKTEEGFFLKDDFGSEYKVNKIFKHGIALEDEFGTNLYLEASTSNNLDEIAKRIDPNGTGTRIYSPGDVGFVIHNDYDLDITKAKKVLENILKIKRDAQVSGEFELRRDYKVSESGPVDVYFLDINKYWAGSSADGNNIITGSAIEAPGKASLVDVLKTFAEVQSATQGHSLERDVYVQLVNYNNDTGEIEFNVLGKDVEQVHNAFDNDMKIQGASSIQLAKYIAKRSKLMEFISKRNKLYSQNIRKALHDQGVIVFFI